MSSFICNPKHFNSIERELKLNIAWNRIAVPATLKNDFPVFFGREFSPETKEAEITSIMNTLRALNATCVCLQYKHHYAGILDQQIETETNQLIFDQGDFKDLSKRGLYNALQCLNYQIETEHLIELRKLTKMEEKSMKFLREMIIHLAIELIAAAPELLEALQRYVKYMLPATDHNYWYNKYKNHENVDTVLVKAIEAINKATE